MTDDSVETSPAVSRPAISTLAEQFNRIVLTSFGISSKELLHDLLGDHFALGWGGPNFRDQFGIICEVRNPAVIHRFLMAGKAQPFDMEKSDPTPDRRVKLYRLEFPFFLAAVIDNRQLILATSKGPENGSMFYSMVELAKGTSDRSLRRNTFFQAAAKSVSPEYRFLFVLMTGGWFDGPQGNQRLGALFDELQKNVRFIALSDVPRAKTPSMQVFIQPRYVDPAFLPDRPLRLDPFMRNIVSSDNDLIYASVIDTNRWYQRIVELADKGFVDAKQYRAMIDLVLPDREVRERLIASLGSELVLMVSSSKPSKNVLSTRAAMSQGPVTPEMALVVRADDPALAVSGASQIFSILGGFLTIQNLASGSNDSAGQLRREIYHGMELQHLNLGHFASAESQKSALESKLELTWIMVGRYLIVTTSSDLAKRMVDRTISLKSETQPAAVLMKESELPASANWVMSFNPQVMANHFQVLTEMAGDIWPALRHSLDSATGEKSPFRVKLGIGSRIVKMAEEDRRVIQVAAVLPGYPAWDKLRIGDLILDIDGEALDPVSPQKDLHQKVNALLQEGQNIKIRIYRAGELKDIEIPASTFNGMVSFRGLKVLHRLLVAFGRQFNEIHVACNYAPDGQICLQFDFTPHLSSMTKPSK